MKKGKTKKSKIDPIQMYRDAWGIMVACIAQLQVDPKDFVLWQQLWMSAGFVQCFTICTMPEAFRELTASGDAKLWNELINRWGSLETWLEKPTDQNPFEGLRLPKETLKRYQDCRWELPS
ncbi:MAG: hypothetical protein HY914_10070 [Desulfomonile tiedjei]|nr:hypothetical protein [Desulfomonile tiedjei]